MEWKKFEEKKVELPENLVKSTLEGFSIATKNLADLIIKPINNSARINSNLDTTFQFQVFLISERLPDYKLEIFRFGYNVEIYPVRLLVSQNVIDNYVEIQWYENPEPTICENDESLKKELQITFNSNKFTEIVSGLMKIASNEL